MLQGCREIRRVENGIAALGAGMNVMGQTTSFSAVARISLEIYMLVDWMQIKALDAIIPNYMHLPVVNVSDLWSPLQDSTSSPVSFLS